MLINIIAFDDFLYTYHFSGMRNPAFDEISTTSETTVYRHEEVIEVSKIRKQ